MVRTTLLACASEEVTGEIEEVEEEDADEDAEDEEKDEDVGDESEQEDNSDETGEEAFADLVQPQLSLACANEVITGEIEEFEEADADEDAGDEEKDEEDDNLGARARFGQQRRAGLYESGDDE